MDEERPNPDQILTEIKREEKKNAGGKLKIFFGMAAGVGKTYAMLQEAQKLQKDGVDVCVGIVNTHGRKETAQLLEGLKIIPEKWISYKDTVFQELDIDEILRIKPQLVLIDELAHTNVPGSRHPKRWQDVMEILDSGIDVLTTLNVQHVESRKDVVETVTGVQIRETVPDLVIERANDIELVDITPDELLERLHEGKVYVGDQSILAAKNFFQEQSLIALREIALRLTAEKVDHDLHGFKGSWRVRERLMVAVSPSPQSQQLVRTARRLAFELDAPWLAIYVDTGNRLSNEEQARLVANLNLARDLGAEVITIQDLTIADGLHRVAKQKNVSQILVGRPLSSNSIWNTLKKGLIHQLVDNNPSADIVVIRQDAISTLYKKTIRPSVEAGGSWMPYGVASLSVMMSTVLGYLLLPYLGYRAVGLIYFLNCILLSAFQKKGAVIYGSVLSGLLWNFLFVPPTLSLKIGDNEDTLLLISYFVITLAIGLMSSRIKEKENLLRSREEHTHFLYEIEKEIANALSISHLRLGLAHQLKKIFSGDFDLIIKNSNDQLIIDSPIEILKEEKEKVVALWVFNHDKVAGWSTDTLPAAKGIYFPVRGFGETVGVLAFQPKYPRPFTVSEMNFLQTVTHQLGVYIQRDLAKEKMRHQDYSREREMAQQSILHSFSHAIHHPLAELHNSIEELKIENIDPQKRAFIVAQMDKSFGDLRVLVRNILVTSNLSSGLVHLAKSKQNIRLLILSSLDKIKHSQDKHRFQLEVSTPIPQINVDPSLIGLALYNIFINALMYSPPPKPIVVTVSGSDKSGEGELLISVKDEGPGIPEAILPYIFEKFYQADVPGAETKGLGLGLAVTKAIIEMHHGKLEAFNRKEGGAEFIIRLPLESI